jgi:flagellar motor switch protein FliN/FliY
MNDLSPSEIEALSRVMFQNPPVVPVSQERSPQDRENPSISTSDSPKGSIARAQFMQFQDQETQKPQSPAEREQLQSVKVTIEVVLGRSKLPINDILNLHSGSIITLDKLAGEPVEILANGTHIAYGEVVIVDHNFGVKILEVAPTIAI